MSPSAGCRHWSVRASVGQAVQFWLARGNRTRLGGGWLGGVVLRAVGHQRVDFEKRPGWVDQAPAELVVASVGPLGPERLRTRGENLMHRVGIEGRVSL